MSNLNTGNPFHPGHFGIYGGRYVPEMLIPALDEITRVYNILKKDKKFQEELSYLEKTFTGRPSPLYHAKRLSEAVGGANIYLKLESHNHTGAHKINNALGQALVARKLGKKRLVAETGAGQHGVATATVAARFGFDCTIHMGEVDVARQYPNVFSMKVLGAEVKPVKDGTRTLKDAVNAAFKDWVENLESTHYLFGSALGPAPYPEMVRDFQSVIGREVKEQLKKFGVNHPDILVACVGGGSNSIGLFTPFLPDKRVKIYGAEAGGTGPNPGSHASRFNGNGKVGIVQGYKSYFIQDDNGSLQATHSISAGLDYAGVGPELAMLYDQGRVSFQSILDEEALEGFRMLAKYEGILPALESSHAVALGLKLAKDAGKKANMVINISGRGDKDLFITASVLDKENWKTFLKEEVARLS